MERGRAAWRKSVLWWAESVGITPSAEMADGDEADEYGDVVSGDEDAEGESVQLEALFERRQRHRDQRVVHHPLRERTERAHRQQKLGPVHPLQPLRR